MTITIPQLVRVVATAKFCLSPMYTESPELTSSYTGHSGRALLVLGIQDTVNTESRGQHA